jgi:hypothetical protein
MIATFYYSNLAISLLILTKELQHVHIQTMQTRSFCIVVLHAMIRSCQPQRLGKVLADKYEYKYETSRVATWGLY